MLDVAELRETEIEAPAPAGIAKQGDPLSPVFDRALAFAILAKALSEQTRRRGPLAERLGLDGRGLARFTAFCGWTAGAEDLAAGSDAGRASEPEEQGWIRDLLRRHAAEGSMLADLLAAVIARRAMEASHLWEDLGLDSRRALNDLMHRHFPALAAMNCNGMRWKRFFYRQLCEEEGVVHCTSPTCSACCDVDKCFEPGSAERMIAAAKSAPA